LQIIAVLEKKAGLFLGRSDVYVNVVGGLAFEEPSGDLGICAAIATSLLDRSVDPGLLIVGEVGLTGEIRPVSHLEAKLKEAAKLGFKRAIVPSASLPLPGSKRIKTSPESIKISQVQSIVEALRLIMPSCELTSSKAPQPGQLST